MYYCCIWIVIQWNLKRCRIHSITFKKVSLETLVLVEALDLLVKLDHKGRGGLLGHLVLKDGKETLEDLDPLERLVP